MAGTTYTTVRPSGGARWSALWASAAVVGTLVVLSVGAWMLYDTFGRPAWETQSLRATLSGGGDLYSAVENTSELCAVVGCDEGWHTSVGNYLLFRTEGLAEYGSAVIGGDSVRNWRIVLDRNGFDLTERERTLSVDLLFPAHDW